MSVKAARITLRIDRVTVHGAGLDRRALETALRGELGRLLEARGLSALEARPGRSGLRLELPAGKGPLAARVAAATVKAIGS